MKSHAKKMLVLAVAVACMAAAGCATQPYGGGYRDGRPQQEGYGYQPPPSQYGNRPVRCRNCGVVQDVQQVYLSGGNRNGGTLGAVIGAIAGGVLGSTVGKGDGRTAATVAGAVAGGVVGNRVGQRNDASQEAAWRIVVRLDNGQYATVTQRDNPGFRNGDYVELRGDQVYQR